MRASRLPETKVRRPRRLRNAGLSILALLAVLAIAMPIIWMLIATNVRAIAANALAREAAVGRNWTCVGKSALGGFPVSLRYDCDDARFDGILDGHRVTASVKGLHGSLFLLWPSHPTASLNSPMNVERDDGSKLALTWRSFDLGARGLPFGLSTVEAAIAGVTANATTDGQAQKVLDAERLTLAADRRLDGAGPHAIAVAATVTNALSPILDAEVPANGPATGRATLVVDQTDTLMRGSVADRLEDWRLAGGQIRLTDIHAEKGASMIDAEGMLDIDDAHRLHGTINTTVAGVEPVLQKFGIPTGVAAFGGLLTSLLGGSAQAADAKPGAMSLPIRLSDGRVHVGPIGLRAALRPLY